MKKFVVALILSLAFIMSKAFYLEASPVQVLNFKDGGSDMVEVSQREINILKLPSSEIKIVSNSPNIDVKILGENALLQYVGEVQPTSLVLLSKKGVYSITLIPRGIPSATIVIKDDQADRAEALQWETSFPYVKTLTTLIKSMYTEVPPDGYRVERFEAPITPLWEGTQLIHKFRYNGATLVGDVYELKNVSGQDMVVKPAEFYSKGVLAVSVDTEGLKDGQSTKVYVVRQSSHGEQRPLFKSVKSPLLR